MFRAGSLKLVQKPALSTAIHNGMAWGGFQSVKLSTGTLYGALYRLLDQGLIEQIESKDEVRGKKAYRLTPSGMEVFDAEVGRMKQLLLVIEGRVPAEGGQ